MPVGLAEPRFAPNFRRDYNPANRTRSVMIPNSLNVLRTLVVTAADEDFAGLLRGLVESLHHWEPRPYSALACFDLGLARATRDWIAQRAAHVIEPGWDLPVHEALRRTQPHLRALTVRPFLRRYLLGYDVYLWIDSDAWVQERSAIEAYFANASDGSIAVASHDHPAYRHSSGLADRRIGHLRAYFGTDAGAALSCATYWNAGVFALGAEAPHWDKWSQYFAQGLAATTGKLCNDQTALNHAITVERLPVAALPARCNWLCHLALPAFDEHHSRFCDPLDHQTTLGILHLTASTKNLTVRLRGDELGRTRNLRYPAG